jgi:UDP-glucose 4-epimerase
MLNRLKRALITGGSGFIGSYLCKELIENKYDVTVFDLREPSTPLVKFIKGNILQFELLKDAIKNHDIVFHLAGILGTEYLCNFVREAVSTNIIGTVNIFECAKALGVKVINTGLTPEWDNPYMITKKAAMRLGRMYYKEFGVDITTLEVTHVYGPAQQVEPYHKAIPSFITQALREEPLDIYGSGQKYMDCIYVGDIVKAIRLAAESPKVSGEVFQVGGGEIIKVVDLALKIIALTNSKSSLRFLPMRQGEPDENNYFMTINKENFLQFFNWQPTTILEEGLLKTIEWYSKNS